MTRDEVSSMVLHNAQALTRLAMLTALVVGLAVDGLRAHGPARAAARAVPATLQTAPAAMRWTPAPAAPAPAEPPAAAKIPAPPCPRNRVLDRAVVSPATSLCAGASRPRIHAVAQEPAEPEAGTTG